MDVLTFLAGVAIGGVAAWTARAVTTRGKALNGSADLSQVVAEVRRDDPELAAEIAAAPAIAPEQIPELLTSDDLERPEVRREIERIPSPELKAVLGALAGWHPRSRDGREEGYERSLYYRLRRERVGYGFKAKERIQIPGTRRWIQPDLVVGQKLLVELKADLVNASASDRSLGQILRYMVFWKTRGPALLVICGECDALTRTMLRKYVRLWRTELRLPVLLYVVRYEGRDAEASAEQIDAVIEAEIAAARAQVEAAPPP